MKIQAAVFWVVTPCNQHFGGPSGFHLHGEVTHHYTTYTSRWPVARSDFGPSDQPQKRLSVSVALQLRTK